MRYLFCSLIIGVVIVAGCSKTQDILIPDGHYSGTFRRVSAGIGDTAFVAIDFSANQFEGQVKSSPQQNYPTICKGTYSIDGTTIHAANQSFFTANFDWSFIFSGDYQYARLGDSLTITRDYNGIFRDEYRLLRLKR